MTNHHGAGRRNDSPMPNPARGWKRPPANGLMQSQRKDKVKYKRVSDARSITILFDADTFNEVRDLALRSGVSFSEKVRQLVEWGLEA